MSVSGPHTFPFPAQPTLHWGNTKGGSWWLGLAPPHPLQALSAIWTHARLPFPAPSQFPKTFTSSTPFPKFPLFFRAPGPAHQAGHCTIAFKETVRVDMAGAVGWAVAGPGREAAMALVAQEAQATGTTLERALRGGKQWLLTTCQGGS